MNPLVIIAKILLGPLNLFTAHREIDRESAWLCLGLFVAVGVVWFLLRRTWLRWPLAILAVLGWLFVGLLSLGPV